MANNCVELPSARLTLTGYPPTVVVTENPSPPRNRINRRINWPAWISAVASGARLIIDIIEWVSRRAALAMSYRSKGSHTTT